MDKIANLGTTSIFNDCDWILKPGKVYRMHGFGTDLYRIKDNGKIDYYMGSIRPCKKRDGEIPLLLLRIIEMSPWSISCIFLVSERTMISNPFAPSQAGIYFKKWDNETRD